MSMRPQFSAAVICLSLALGSAGVGAAWAETLQDAVAMAYQTNPGLQAQRATLRALNESHVQARAGYGLTVSVTAQQTYNELVGGVPTQSSSNTTAAINLAQPLFTGGRVNAQINAADASIMGGRERLRRSESDLLQRVIATYVAVRRDQQLVKISADAVTVLEQQLKDAQARFAVRDITRTDVAQAQARLAAAQTQFETVQSQLATSRSQYLDAVGQNPGELAPEPDLPPPPADLDAAITLAEEQSPLLLEARFAELASRARLAEAKATFNPSVTLGVRAARAPSSTFQPTPHVDEVVSSLTLSQPLFSGGLYESQVRQARAQNESDRRTAENTQRSVMDSVAQAWNQLTAARRSLRFDEMGVSANETAFEGEGQEQKYGLRTTIEALNALQELTSAQIQIVRDRYTAYVAQAALLAATGQLEAKAIVPDIDTYDPQTAYRRVRNIGALPWEPVIRLIDKAPDWSSHRLLPVVPTSRPDNAAPLPPPPVTAASVQPSRSAADLMATARTPPLGAADH